ncbi:hypothetical protein BHF71_02540 [Vulcanibacillus modesticaldus]|uniref:Serine/threonine-protein kinase PrkC n=1 Tax=Vulcanibacillus modesticaldus TaxID=337097 RepID=A0A1D2YTP7_9BACI|nr:Stk1 family PASTA domain-containing Ser/Thr kinase [Vulcanibacillus modesticaldus]OEF99080.1 hypothetical protein BHF71_02540 [Vulcanibacillus modesticaldus]
MIGTILGHRYKLLEKIGGGGMADVYRALDQILLREVAVKILRQQYAHDNEFIKRFQREAHAAASLSHKNVVAIYDVGEEKDKDIHYIVMEYVEGFTLKDLIRKKGRLPVKEALDIAEKICSALDHAHQNHIVHRDIKPHNILIGYHGEVKVTDFGIARAVSEATITHTSSVLGSVHYLSPEQARGGWTDEKTDLYSLGIVLYEMVTGKLPFSGDSPISVALKHLQEDFIYPKEIDPNIPQSVENIILKALVKDPTKRYSSAKEMLIDLQTALNLDRVNEPQFQVDEDDLIDDQETMIIPALKEIDDNEHTTFSKHSRRERKRSILSKLTIVFIVISFILLGVYGFQSIVDKFIVPEVKVPALELKNKDDAVKILNDLNLNYQIVERFDSNVEKGLVIKQEPSQGSVIKVNQEVTLFVSLGKEKVAMPNLINKQRNTASFILQQQGFTNVEIIDAYSDKAPSGEVFRQEPLPEELVIPDETKILLFISKGKEKFEMPNLIGLTESEARAILLKYDLEIGEIKKDFTFEQDKGKVYRQFPFDPGREVTIGDKVDLYISLGYPQDAKSIYSDILVPLNGDQQAEITIVIRDSRERDIVWKKENVTGSKFYDQIELILLPGHKGTISVYKDGKLYLKKTVDYY